MPSTSAVQHRAMEAAAHGKSTLGIPRKVGEEFIGKDDAPQAAGVVFASPRGRVLLMHRAPEEKNYGGHWGLPGGKAEDGETPEAAARREVKEETGYEHAGSLKPLDRVHTPNGMVFTTFAAPVDKEFAPEMADGEHTGFTWADLEHLPQPLHPGVARVLGEHLGVTADMSPEDWDGLRSGFATWMHEEDAEPKHAADAFNESDHPRASNGEFGVGGGSERRDTAETNIPMSGVRGKRLDAEIARNVAQQKKGEEAAGKSAREKQRTDEASAKSLLKEHAAGMLKAYGPKLGEAKVKEHLDWMSKTHPAAFVKFVDKYLAEQAAKATDALDELAAGIDDASGRLTEEERAEAGRNAQEREEQPDDVFLLPPDKYPVKVKQGGKWVYSRDLLLAAAREARMHGHEDLAKRADAIRNREFAQDAIALDRSTVRRVDQDGHLFVEMTPISKANVCPYYGREIPDYEALGLDPEKTYRLYRDAGELAKAVSTFAGKPLLLDHTPVSAEDHPTDKIVGSIGDDVQFNAPYLMAPLNIWRADAIALIESGSQKELSCGYRYRADMTPGTVDGEPYDGVMRDIVGNHLALVSEGRAGPDVVVQDSKPSWRGKFASDHQPKEAPVAKILLTRKAAVAQGALMTFLAPKLAQDAKLDLAPILDGITAKNFKAKRADLLTGVSKLTVGKLATDAKLDGLDTILMALDDVEPLEANSAVPAGKAKDKKAKDDMPKNGLREFLKDKLSAEDMAACDEMLDDDQEAMDEDEEEERKKAAEKKAEDEEQDDKVDKKAMDAAIESRVKQAQDEMRRSQREVREAEDVVRPYVGKLAMAHDSAADVYRTALGALGVKDVDKLHPDALKPVLLAQPVPGSGARPAVAMDAAGVNSFHELFPEAKSHPVKTL